MRFPYFVPLTTSQDCRIPVIQFQQFIPEDRLAAPIRSTFSWMTTARICLTGVTLPVQHDLCCVYYLNQSTVKIGDHADGNYIAVKMCIARFH